MFLKTWAFVMRVCLGLCFLILVTSAASVAQVAPMRTVRFLSGPDPYLEELLAEATATLPNPNFVVKRLDFDSRARKAMDEVAPYGRGPFFLSEKRSTDLVAAGQYPDWAKKLEVVRIPLTKGLLGQFVFRTLAGQENDFREIRNLQSLAKVPIGMGFDWSEVDLYKHNGLKVVTGPTHLHLERMLLAGRFKLFMRNSITALLEYSEVDHNKAAPQRFGVEQNLVLTAPVDHVFYMRKEDAPIARQLEAGFHTILKNGIFEKVLNKHFGKVLKKVCLSKRRQIVLKKPFSFPSLREDDADYWRPIPDSKSEVCEPIR
jgi:hypothetical protein